VAKELLPIAMALRDDGKRLSEISTQWKLVRQAHSGRPAEASQAQLRLLLRYGAAVNRYLLGALRDADAAEELGQEFAYRFIRGDFQGADPARGRFRDYLKAVLVRMVAQYHQAQRNQLPLVPALVPARPAEDSQVVDADVEFLKIWRRVLLNRAWEALARLQQQIGQPCGHRSLAPPFCEAEVHVPSSRPDHHADAQRTEERAMLVREPVRVGPAALECIVEEHILKHAGRRIRQLHVQVAADRVIVHGQTSCYYVKQLAILAVREALTALGSRLVADVQIEVGSSDVSPRVMMSLDACGPRNPLTV
jgi:hypothetical protein